MKHNSFLLVIFLGMALFFMPNQTFAQSKKKRKSKDEEKVPLIDKLWFGGNFVLGGSSNGRYRQFVFGLTPLVGYKFTERLSAGPKVGFTFINGKFINGTVAQPDNWVRYEGGAFVRYKILRQIFAHTEYEHLYIKGIHQEVSNSDNNFYIGAGYTDNGGALLGYEIMLLYNVTTEPTSTDLPWNLRVGFNYRF